MKAWIARELSGPSCLKLEEMQVLSPGPGEVLVEVAARGVNFADTFMVVGRYPGVKAPLIPGLEAAGVVVEASSGSRFRSGDRVMGLLRGGGWATHACLREDFTLKVPDDYSWEEAGAFPETFFTAWHLLETAGQVKKGETLLITAAAGGVGTSLLQLTRGRGLRVLAAASSAAKLEGLKSLADFEVVEYGSGGLAGAVRALTGGAGADVALESVGGDVFEEALDSLALLGRMVIYGAASGEMRPIPAPKVLGRMLGVCGFLLGKMVTDRPDLVRAGRDGLEACLAAGGIRPRIGTVIPFAEAPRGLSLIRDRGHVGKIVLAG